MFDRRRHRRRRRHHHYRHHHPHPHPYYHHHYHHHHHHHHDFLHLNMIKIFKQNAWGSCYLGDKNSPFPYYLGAWNRQVLFLFA